jgi:hypothetical protein
VRGKRDRGKVRKTNSQSRNIKTLKIQGVKCRESREGRQSLVVAIIIYHSLRCQGQSVTFPSPRIM